MKLSILFIFQEGKRQFSILWVVVLTLPFFFSCYHLRNTFTCNDCSIAEIVLYYGRAFDSLDVCVLRCVWEFYYRCYWFGLHSSLRAAVYICHLTVWWGCVVVCLYFISVETNMCIEILWLQKNLWNFFWKAWIFLFVCFLFLLWLLEKTKTYLYGWTSLENPPCDPGYVRTEVSQVNEDVNI